MKKLCLYVCENYFPDVAGACERKGWTDVAVIPFPSMCFSKVNRKETALLLSEKATADCEKVVVCNEHCDFLTLAPTSDEMEKHTASFCFSHLASDALIDYIIAKKGYIIGSGWLKRWRTKLSEAGFNQETAISFHHSFCQELVYFDTGFDPDAETNLRDLSRYLDLPYVMLPADKVRLNLMLENAVFKHRLQENRKPDEQTMASLQVQCAEYAAILDLIGRISANANRRDMIEKVKDIFTMVLGAQHFKFWSHEEDPDHLPADIRDLFLHADRDFLFFREANRFCLNIQWNGKLFGAIDVSGFLFPTYIGKYMNFAIEIVKICGLAFSNAEQYEKLLKSEQDLRYLGSHDALTGLYNRSHINEIIDRKFLPSPFTVFMFDIDHLKLTNDQYGHAEGDKLIITVASILKKHIRESDDIARIGGDEFVAILHGTDEDGAVAIRERIRSHIAVFNEQRSDHPLPISFSMGYAIGKTPEDTVESMMILADERMYQDKLKSRPKT